MTWEEYFLKIAEVVAEKSKDPSTKVGAVIVGKDNQIVSLGFNGFPRGIKDLEERYHDRDIKYKLIVHAEVNAILNAARNGVGTEGCFLYLNYIPCNECAKAIIQAGIKKVCVGYDLNNRIDFNERWRTQIEFTKIMFNEAEIELKEIVNLNTYKPEGDFWSLNEK